MSTASTSFGSDAGAPGSASSGRPHLLEGAHCWVGTVATASFVFVGKRSGKEGVPTGTPLLSDVSSPGDDLSVPGRPDLPVAHVRQVHGRRVVPGKEGLAGEADAMETREANLALCIKTADCVPVLLAVEAGIVAVHAGWRGLRSGIVRRAVEKLPGRSPAAAVIGPHIGPCCYEVGEDVATEIEAVLAEDSRAVLRAGGGKPHIDLGLAVEEELLAAGLHRIERFAVCTRCSPDELWSYRRDGPEAGRNFAFVWLDEASTADRSAG